MKTYFVTAMGEEVKRFYTLKEAINFAKKLNSKNKNPGIGTRENGKYKLLPLYYYV